MTFPICCRNCKKVMEQSEYYDGHLNNAECLARQEELDKEWKEHQAELAKKWKRM